MVTPFKIKKNQNIGGLAAETDPLLGEVFVDTGYIEKLLDSKESKFLIIGRTGAGKTALLKQIETTSNIKVAKIEPEVLSMQYLYNSQVVGYLNSIGINLQIFYKFLWKHILILEYITIRYDSGSERNSITEKLMNKFSGGEPTVNKAREYVEKYGKEFFIRSDTKIKEITEQFESKFTNDSNLKIDINKVASYAKNATNNQTDKLSVSSEVQNRANSIVNEYLLSNLKAIMDLLEVDSHKQRKEKCFILIDDLDKDWMPDEFTYFELLLSLIESVKDLNNKFKDSCKIIVALRSDILYHLKDKMKKTQFEKWNDFIIEVKWENDELIDIMNKRINEVFKPKYTGELIDIREILPTSRKKSSRIAIDYILERTFLRPRDIIDFFNKIINISSELKFTWEVLHDAERGYSRTRYQALLEEWKKCFDGIEICTSILPKVQTKFAYNDINTELIMEIFTDYKNENFAFIHGLMKQAGVAHDIEEILPTILDAFYIMGIIGISLKNNHIINYSFFDDINSQIFQRTMVKEYHYSIHPMFYQEFGVDYSNQQNNIVNP